MRSRVSTWSVRIDKKKFEHRKCAGRTAALDNRRHVARGETDQDPRQPEAVGPAAGTFYMSTTFSLY
jgi:hypothetical protein